MKKLILSFFALASTLVGFGQCSGTLVVFEGPGETEFCQGLDLTFQVTNISGAGCVDINDTYFDWSIDDLQDGLGSDHQEYSLTTSAGETTVTVDVYDTEVDAGNLLFSETIVITVPDPIVVSVDVLNGDPACEDIALNLEASVSGGQGDLEYDWSNPAISADDDENALVSGSNVDVGDSYTVVVTDELGCEGTGISAFAISTSPNLDLESTYDFCEGSDASIDFSIAGSNTYSWRKLPGNNVQTPANGVLEISSIGTNDDGSYELTVTNANGCSDSATITISVDETSNTTLSLDIPFDCNGGYSLSSENTEIQMTTSPGGGFYEINDAAPGAAISNDELILGNLGLGGPYNVSYTAVEGTCENSASVEFMIFPELSVGGFASEISICAGSELIVTAVSEPGSAELDEDECQWTFGVNQQNSCELDLNNVSEDLDDTEFTIMAIDENGCNAEDSFTLSVGVLNVEINPDPAESGISSYCSNNGTFNLNGTPSGGEWVVLNGNQNIVDNNGIFNPSLSGPGSFDITYSVTEGSCTDTEPITITVVALPVLDAISNQTICANSPVFDLTDLVSQNNVSFCNASDEVIEGGLFDPAAEGVGVYSITGKLISESNCTSEDSFTIEVVEAFTAAGDPALGICTGGTPTLGVELTNGNSPFTFTWSNSGLLDDANSSTPSLNPGEIQATTEFVATIVDDNDCIATATQTVNVFQQPSALVLSQSPICADEQSCLTATYEGGVEPAIYNWSGGNIQSTDECDYLTDPITEATEFNLSLSFEADTYCNSVNEELNVIISSTPDPQVQNLPTTVCQGQQVVLFADNIITGSEVTWLVSPISAIEESSPSGQVFVLNISEDFTGDELSVSVQERYPSPSTCVWTNTFDVAVSNQIAAEPAEIFYSPVNDVLVYNDSEPDCYQWGYFDSIPAPGDPSFVIIPGQTYQSFVPVVYDPDITYWCQAWYGDCNASASCANMSIRSSTIDSPLPIYSPEFLLYPNPNSGDFRLQMNNLFPEQEYELRVINALGQVISIQNFETYSKEAQVIVDLGEIASGLYHLGVYRNSQLEKMTPFIVDNQ